MTGRCPSAKGRLGPPPSPPSMPSAWPGVMVWPSNTMRPPRRPGSATRTRGVRHMRSGLKTPGASPPSCPSSRNTACPEPDTGISCAPLPKTGWCWTVCSTFRTPSKRKILSFIKSSQHVIKLSINSLFSMIFYTCKDPIPIPTSSLSLSLQHRCAPRKGNGSSGEADQEVPPDDILGRRRFFCPFWLILGAR